MPFELPQSTKERRPNFKLRYGAFRDPVKLPRSEQLDLENKAKKICPEGAHIFQDLIKRNEEGVAADEAAQMAKIFEDPNRDISELWFSELPASVQREILENIRTEIRPTLLLNDFSLAHCRYLVEHGNKENVVVFHVSGQDLKVGDYLKTGKNEEHVFFSRDIHNLFKSPHPKYIYALKLNKDLVDASSGYCDEPAFLRLMAKSEGFKIEDKITITPENMKQLDADFSTYRAAGLPNFDDSPADAMRELKF